MTEDKGNISCYSIYIMGGYYSRCYFSLGSPSIPESPGDASISETSLLEGSEAPRDTHPQHPRATSDAPQGSIWRTSAKRDSSVPCGLGSSAHGLARALLKCNFESATPN